MTSLTVHNVDVYHQQNETHSYDVLFSISGTSTASVIITLTLITNTLLLLILSRVIHFFLQSITIEINSVELISLRLLI